MLKIIIGVVLGIIIYHNFPGEVVGFGSKATEVFHESAKKAADLTAPQSTVDKLIEKVK